MLGRVLNGARADVHVEWDSAHFGPEVATIPLEGVISQEWISHLAHVISDLPSNGHEWGSIEVGPRCIQVGKMRQTSTAELFSRLERAVNETNAAFAHDRDEPAAAQRPGSTAVSFALIALAALALVLQSTDWTFPARPVVVVAFVAIAPGWAILRLWGLAHSWAGLGLAIALSLALAMLVSGAMLYAGAWSPVGSLAILAGVTAAAAAASLARVSR
jgi:hypothetical protein